MSLTNIVSGIVNKESKVDRKKMAYFFKDYDRLEVQVFSVRILLSLLKPETIGIIDTQTDYCGGETDKQLEYLRATIKAILPDAKVIYGYGHIKEGVPSELVFQDKDAPTKEELDSVELGFFIGKNGDLTAYKGTYVPAGPLFHVEKFTEESIAHYLEQDLDVLLPTENMWLVNELTRNREAEIAICYFGTDEKRTTIKTVNAITSALMNSSIKVCLSNHYFTEDFKDWYPEKEAAKLFDMQHDFVLAIRGDRIDVHLPFENGAVSKIPNGWLLLN